MQEHANEVQRVVSMRYAELLDDYQHWMVLGDLCSILDEAALKKHLLPMEAHTLESGILDGNYYNQIQTLV